MIIWYFVSFINETVLMDKIPTELIYNFHFKMYKPFLVFFFLFTNFMNIVFFFYEFYFKKLHN